MSDPKPHPVADLFPLLPPDELQELADDIAERGLLQPIVLDEDGRILDGRNRYAACKVHGIAPEFVTYEGDDPGGYAVSVNVRRRNLSKGQIAMVLAESESVSPGNTFRDLAMRNEVSATGIAKASAVLDHAPDYVDAVKSGATPLNEAYRTAQERKRAAEQTADALDELRSTAPDLADLVAEERMPLSEALAAARERAREHKEEIERSARSIRDFASAYRVAKAATHWKHFDEVVPHIDERDMEIVQEVLQ